MSPIINEYVLCSLWNYYLSLERDMDNTSRYIEPLGQEDVYSFEFAKLIILSCTEIESVFKKICFVITNNQVEGNISSYKEIILGKYPKITKARVFVLRLGKILEPFKGWDEGKLEWWTTYQEVKHNRGEFFFKATYKYAVNSLAALYVLIFYLSKITGYNFPNHKSEYITSEYSSPYLLCRASKELPDFEVLTP